MDATLEELCVQQETEDQNYEMYSVHFFFLTNAGKSETAERKAKLSTREQIFSGNIKKAGFWN